MTRIPLTYCSFADAEFKGALVLDGHLNPLEAAMLAHAQGFNPGGELLAIPLSAELPEEEYEQFLAMRGRGLISAAELAALGFKKLREWEEEEESTS